MSCFYIIFTVDFLSCFVSFWSGNFIRLIFEILVLAQAAQQERSTFVSSLLPILAEYNLQPPVPDAQSIVSNVRVSIISNCVSLTDIFYTSMLLAFLFLNYMYI